jgi:hypothetical protein
VAGDLPESRAYSVYCFVVVFEKIGRDQCGSQFPVFRSCIAQEVARVERHPAGMALHAQNRVEQSLIVRAQPSASPLLEQRQRAIDLALEPFLPALDRREPL